MSRISHPNLEVLVGFIEDPESCTTWILSDDLTESPDLSSFIAGYILEPAEQHGLVSLFTSKFRESNYMSMEQMHNIVSALVYLHTLETPIMMRRVTPVGNDIKLSGWQLNVLNL